MMDRTPVDCLIYRHTSEQVTWAFLTYRKVQQTVSLKHNISGISSFSFFSHWSELSTTYCLAVVWPHNMMLPCITTSNNWWTMNTHGGPLTKPFMKPFTQTACQHTRLFSTLQLIHRTLYRSLAHIHMQLQRHFIDCSKCSVRTPLKWSYPMMTSLHQTWVEPSLMVLFSWKHMQGKRLLHSHNLCSLRDLCIHVLLICVAYQPLL